MTESSSPPDPLHQRLGLAAIGLGLVAVVAATLMLASAGYGTEAKTDFATRRSYNMVKRDVHRVLPWVVIQGIAGVGLMMWGTRMRSRGRSEE